MGWTDSDLGLHVGWVDFTMDEPTYTAPIASEGEIYPLADGLPQRPGDVGGVVLEFDPSIDEMEDGTQLDGPYGVEFFFESNFYRIEFVATF